MDYAKEQWNGTITAINATQKTVRLILKVHLHGNISKYSIPPKVDTIQQGKLCWLINFMILDGISNSNNYNRQKLLNIVDVFIDW